MMGRLDFFSLLVASAASPLLVTPIHSAKNAATPLGTLDVDQSTLPRLASFADVFVKVDRSYAANNDHAQFREVAKRYFDASDYTRDDFLIATISVDEDDDDPNLHDKKDANAPLALELGAGRDMSTYPEYFILKKGTKNMSEAIKYTGSDKTTQALVSFIMAEVGVHLGPPGTLASMDDIAAQFMKASGNGDRQVGLVTEAKKVTERYTTTAEKEIAMVYIKLMEKALEKGMSYFKMETSRVERMLDEGKISEAKRKTFENKLNVMDSFTVALKDEL